MDEDKRELDIGNVFSEDITLIKESERIRFARQLLVWVGLMCVGIFIAFGVWPDNKALASMFELVKIGVLPLVTLIVSFYFPSSGSQN